MLLAWPTLCTRNAICEVLTGKESEREGIDACGGLFRGGVESRKAIAKKGMCELDFVGLMKIFNCLCQKDIPSIR